MDRLIAFERRLRPIVEVLAWVAMAGLLVQCLVIFADVAMRWLLNRPIYGVDDITRLLVIVVITACFPACIIKRGNISIRIIGRLVGRRGQKALDAIGAAGLLVFVFFLAWQVLHYAEGVAETGELTWVLRLEVAPAFFAAGLIIAVCVPLQVLCTVVDAARAWLDRPSALEDRP